MLFQHCYMPLFTGVILQICELLQHIDSLENEAEIEQLVTKLTVVDPLRRGYYDYLSKCLQMINVISTFYLNFP